MYRAVVLVAVGFALALPGRAAAEGAVPKLPALGSTASSEAPVQFVWNNPYTHPMGMDQVLYVATDPDFQDIVFQHGDYCGPMALCPQGTSAPAFAPGTYYWKIHLY